LVLRTLNFFLDSEALIFERGTDESLDVSRAHLLLSLLALHRSSLIPIYTTITEYAAVGLEYMTCHLLDVRDLSKDIQSSIKMVVRRLTEAFSGSHSSLSGMTIKSEEDERILTANSEIHCIVTDYFDWLRAHQTALKKQSHETQLIRSIDFHLRRQIHKETFMSPKHLIKVFREKYAAHMSSLVLSVTAMSPRDLEQAMKDVCRETIMVEGESCQGDQVPDILLSLAKRALQRSRSSSLELLDSDAHVHTLSGGTCEIVKKNLSGEATALGTISSDKGLANRTDSSPVKTSEGGVCTGDSLLQENLALQLSRFMFLACSRTIAAGDALVIVDDLFGGKGLVFCPVRSASHTNVFLTPGGLKICLEASYNLYVRQILEESPANTSIVPVISIKTTITTLLLVRSLGMSTKDMNINLFKTLLFFPEKLCLRTLNIEPFYDVCNS